jgi:hypothetical protein
MPDAIDDLESRYGCGPLKVHIRQDVKRDGEPMATYEVEYRSLREAMLAIAGDLREAPSASIATASAGAQRS